MSPEIQAELLKLLKDSKEFALTQAPEVFQQTLRYEFWSNLSGLFFSGFLLCVSYWLLRSAGEESRKLTRSQNEDGKIYLWYSVGMVIGVISTFGIVWYIDTLMKIQVAPKYFLIQKFTSRGSRK